MSENSELSKYGAASVGCHSRALRVALTCAGRRPSPPDAWAAGTGAQMPGEVLRRGQGREKGSCRKPGGREVPSGHRGQPTRSSLANHVVKAGAISLGLATSWEFWPRDSHSF